jgi:phosphohistidine phosphatase
MKDLFLIRHAHAGPYLMPDEGRHLSIRGIEEAQILKQILKEKKLPIGFWHVSNTVRTRETAEILISEVEKIGLKFDEFWYHATGPAYVQELVKGINSIQYLVAHNPSISYVASYFSGEMIQMETSACIHLHWPQAETWDEISKGGALVHLIK